jgi:hypothetical protein
MADKYNLPRIDQNMTANIPRDVNALIDAIEKNVNPATVGTPTKKEYDDVAAVVTNHSSRIDTEGRKTEVLSAGKQVINAEKSSAFSLGKIEGRTLINLMGKSGNMDAIADWHANGVSASIAIDNNSKKYGSGSLKLTATGSSSGYATFYRLYNELDKTKYYVVVGEAMISSDATRAAILFEGVSYGNDVTDSTQFKTSFLRIKPTDFDKLSQITVQGVVYGPAGVSANFDGFRIYQISADEYTKLGTMKPEQVAAKYPFVNTGIVGVENPYAIGYGENLLPSLEAWTLNDQANVAKIKGPYTLTLNSTASAQRSFVVVPIIPDTDYMISANVSGGTASTGGYIAVGWLDANGTFISWDAAQVFTGGMPKKAHAPANAVYAQVLCTTTGAGAYEFSDIMFSAGATAKPFKPRHDTMLAFKTELHACPGDGSDPDVLFEKDGQYFKMSKWNKFEFNASKKYSYYWSFAGGKCVRFGANITDRNPAIFPTLVKYDGFKIAPGTPSTAPDVFSIGDWGTQGSGLVLGIGVSNTESGWGEQESSSEFQCDGAKVRFVLPAGLTGIVLPSSVTATVDNLPVSVTSVNDLEITVATAPVSGRTIVINYKVSYAPTDEEIRAYFLGWTMFDGTGGGKSPANGPFNGTGEKWWARREGGIGSKSWLDATKAVPTEPAPDWTPYQLMYRLAKETVKPVVSEGSLTINEGSNIVEVGTGIILREKAPVLTVPGQAAAMGDTSMPSLYKINRLLRVYQDNREDNRWYASGINSYGEEKARVDWVNYSETSLYTMTYTKLDESPIVPFTGSVATNEKAQLMDLVSGVSDALQRVSVVEQKKAEKDSPGWITPTLLNGWENYGNNEGTAAYRKNAYNEVRLRGTVKGGSLYSGLFILPEGYRPPNARRFVVDSAQAPAIIEIYSNGDVALIVGSSAALSLEQISFLAEQ